MTHSINHWLRVEVLAVLHEGKFPASEVAARVGEDVRAVTGALHDLYDSGNIEIAGFAEVGNHKKPIYRAIALPKVTREVYRKMSIPARNDLNGAVTQGILAEMVSAYQTGHMDADENLYLVWEPLTLDAQGEDELHEHLEACLEGAAEICARSAGRLNKSKETGVTKVIGLLAFRRGRPGRPKDGGYLGRFKKRSKNS